jgi:hypothetical protein
VRVRSLLLLRKVSFTLNNIYKWENHKLNVLRFWVKMWYVTHLCDYSWPSVVWSPISSHDPTVVSGSKVQREFDKLLVFNVFLIMVVSRQISLMWWVVNGGASTIVCVLKKTSTWEGAPWIDRLTFEGEIVVWQVWVRNLILLKKVNIEKYIS